LRKHARAHTELHARATRVDGHSVAHLQLISTKVRLGIVKDFIKGKYVVHKMRVLKWEQQMDKWIQQRRIIQQERCLQQTTCSRHPLDSSRQLVCNHSGTDRRQRRRRAEMEARNAQRTATQAACTALHVASCASCILRVAWLSAAARSVPCGPVPCSTENRRPQARIDLLKEQRGCGRRRRRRIAGKARQASAQAEAVLLAYRGWSE
jgi:hypothetical protein